MHRFLRSSSTRLATTRTYLLHSFVVPSYRYFSLFAADGDVDDGGDAPQPWKSMEGLRRCSANHVPLSPISFLERAAKVYRDRTSLVYGCRNFTWNQTHQRCLKLASALSQIGISRGDVVSTLAPNVPAMYELHFAVPMAGAVLCTLNSRLDSAMVSVLLAHSEAKILFVDHGLLEIARGAFDHLAKTNTKPPILVLISEGDDDPSPTSIVPYEYESFLETGHIEFEIKRPKSEWDPISVNYTSGTTSRPKGVVYSRCRFICGPCLCFIVTVGASLGVSRHRVAQTYA
ncbi:hypothetical protein E1A91_D03G003300v1 [Gossypium mustelinum]|uniref:AMP-dependent synthetase/ligase domain-containing protein n=1 Tax=Gossypium mustelinum TaxID=34275 RepID=A0A5D2VI51_GOSMU|nr:hypothetical protein E1A91_D03G003300v1 [Gossypium mustelinum]